MKIINTLLLVFTFFIASKQALSANQKRLDSISIVILDHSYFSPTGLLPIAFEARMQNGKKHSSKPQEIYSDRFKITDKSIVWQNGYLFAQLPELYLKGSKLDLNVGFRSAEKQFHLEYQLPKVIDLDLTVEYTVMSESRLNPRVQLKFDNGAIWNISPWGKDSIWAKCFEMYLNKELVEGDAVFAPGINANSQKTLDYFVIWKPNFEMNSSNLSVMDYNVRYYLNAAGADGKNRGPWDSGHGRHGSNATAINIWLTLDSTTNQLNAKIQRNHYSETKRIFAGIGAIQIVANGGNGGNGGEGETGKEAPEGSGKKGGCGGDGGDGGDGGNGANVNIYYTPETSPYLHQIEILNAGGIGGKGGKGGKGGYDDEVEENLIDIVLNGRGPKGSDGRDGRNGQSGTIDYFLIK
jgi:hypothetical protein